MAETVLCNAVIYAPATPLCMHTCYEHKHFASTDCLKSMETAHGGVSLLEASISGIPGHKQHCKITEAVPTAPCPCASRPHAPGQRLKAGMSPTWLLIPVKESELCQHKGNMLLQHAVSGHMRTEGQPSGTSNAPCKTVLGVQVNTSVARLIEVRGRQVGGVNTEQSESW